MENLTTITIIIALASLGFRAITGKGMILYFLRKPFDELAERESKWTKANDNLIKVEKEIDQQDESNLDARDRSLLQIRVSLLRGDLRILGDYPKRAKLILYIMKPFLLCSTCMASVHTLIWFPIITGEFLTYKLIIVMLMVAFINTIFWSFLEMVQGITVAVKD